MAYFAGNWSHSKGHNMIELMLPDLAEAARRPSAAEQLAARVAGQAHCPVLLRTLHIGGANLKSRATCDSTVPPRSHTDVPAPSGQLTCRICPNNSYRLQAEAIRGLQPRSDRSKYHGSARTGHRRRRFRRMPAAASGTRASRMHRIGSVRLAGSPAVASRPAEATRCLESRASIRTRAYHPQSCDLIEVTAPNGFRLQLVADAPDLSCIPADPRASGRPWAATVALSSHGHTVHK